MERSGLSLWSRLNISASRLFRLRIFKETRTQIVFWYVMLIVSFVLASLPATRQQLTANITERVFEDMEEELEEFEELLVESLLRSRTPLETTQADGSESEKIYQVFDDYLEDLIPEDDNYAITIVRGKFYKASSLVLPEVINTDSKLMKYWQGLTDEATNEISVPDPEIGSIIYQAIPINTSNDTLGVFVIAHTSAGEREEALEAWNVVIKVLILLLLVPILLSWFVAGRVLSPLKKFTSAVQSLNESDLTKRIDVKGGGELALLGNTFNEMMNRLESSFTSQHNFIDDAGHALKKTITTIRRHLKLIDNGFPEQKQESMTLVVNELDRMNRLVNDLTLLAKAERPDFLHIETIDLASFTTEIFDKFQAFKGRRWCLESNLAQGKMTGDRQKITQAIICLANNAVQYTRPNSLISFGMNIDYDTVVFWVRDTGRGIAPEEQQIIFERFRKVNNNSRSSRGYGLGLAIVKAIVEAHGGAINLHSEVGVGSTFTLIFPQNFKQKQIKRANNF